MLEFGKYINKAGLPWQAYDQTIDGRTFIVNGYGRIELSKGWEFSEKLLTTRLNLMTHEECEALFGNDTRYPQLYDRNQSRCSKSVDNVLRNPCKGDSGGGLIYEDELTRCPIVIGVVSTSRYYYCDISTQFVLVSAYKSWIEDTIERFTHTSKPNLPPVHYPDRNRID